MRFNQKCEVPQGLIQANQGDTAGPSCMYCCCLKGPIHVAFLMTQITANVTVSSAVDDKKKK